VLKSVPQAKFYVAGRNAPKWFVKKIEKYKSVQYCGEVENAANFMRSKGIMIVPLLSGSGMRVKIIEGMVLGKAIVSTSIGAEGINAEPQRQIVIANSSQEFVASLVSLLQNIEYAKEMGQQAKEFDHKAFDNCLLTQNLMAFYVQFMQKEVLQHYEQH
jgi:glycosyltransferase involved in cell wall biosynthesis